MEQDFAEKLRELEDIIKAYNPKADFEKLEKAFRFARNAHRGQLRKSGEPFFIHPVAVAKMLAEMDMDMDSIIAAVLHDVVEDTDTTSQD